ARRQLNVESLGVGSQKVTHGGRVAGDVRIGPAWGHEDHDQRERSQPYSETSNAFHAKNLRSPSRTRRGQRQIPPTAPSKRPSIYDETVRCQPESDPCPRIFRKGRRNPPQPGSVSINPCLSLACGNSCY